MAVTRPMSTPGLVSRILDVSPSAVVILDRDAAPLYANSAARSLVGTGEPLPGERNALGGRYPIDVAGAPLRFDPASGLFQRALNGERVVIRDAEVTQPNRKVPLTLDAVPITGERGESVLAVAFILEPRERRSREGLQARLAAIVESSHDAIVQLSFDGRIQSWNTTAERLYGFSSAEAITQGLEMFVHPEYLETMKMALRRIATGGKVEQFESLHQRKDGSRLYVSATMSPVRDTTGRVVAVAVITRDLSERVRADQRERELQEELLKAQKMEALGQLATGVAHDFNTLLTVISANAQFLRDTLPGGDPRCADVDDIINAVTRAARLTSSLITYTKDPQPQPTPVDINEVVDDTTQALRRVIDHGVTMRVTLEPHLGQVLMDKSQLQDVITTLLLSSRDAMPQGGELSVRTARAWLEADMSAGVPGGAYSELTVAHTGLELDPATVRRLFDPYEMTREDSGTDAGLVRVNRSVSEAGGHMTVRSGPGLGTTFSIFLPLLGVQGRAAAAEPPRAAPPGGSETILVIDNDEALCATARRILEGQGYSVIYSAHGPDALAIVRDYPGSLDLVLADVVTPGGGGDDLLEEISESRPNARMVFMSGYAAQQEPRQRLIGPGVSFIAKPYTRDTLLRAVRDALDAPLPEEATTAA